MRRALAWKEQLTSKKKKGPRMMIWGVSHEAAVGNKEEDDGHCLLLPNDLILEILSRVPANSLLRLRQVCKHWFNLISSDSNFINMNLHHSMKHPCILTEATHRDNDRCYLTFYSLNCWSKNYSDHSLSALPSLEQPYFVDDTFLIGHCNGLLCVRHGFYRISVWNPCTKEFKELELPIRPNGLPGEQLVSYACGFYNDSPIDGRKIVSYAYGFGYDSTTDDYKVIAIESYCDNIPEVNCQLITQVCTLGAGGRNNNKKKKVMRWKRIERGYDPYVFRIASMLQEDLCGFSFNGCIYWMETFHNHRIAHVILCFDILKEEYKEILIPQHNNNNDDDYYWLKTFNEYKGSLCIFKGHMHIEDFREVWIMKDDSSWTKVFTINGYLTAVGQSLDGGFISIKTSICNDNGEMIVAKVGYDSVHMIWYNPGNLSKREFGGFRRLGHSMMTGTYTESLVSLNSGTYIGQTCIEVFEEEDEEEEMLWFGRTVEQE